MKAPLGVAKAAGRAVIAELTEVMRYSGQFKARRPGHASPTRVGVKGFAAARFVTGKLLRPLFYRRGTLVPPWVFSKNVWQRMQRSAPGLARRRAKPISSSQSMQVP